METKSVVMGLSGGMDSATILAYYYNKGYKIYPIFFTMDQNTINMN